MGGAVYTTPIQPFRMYFHILSHPLPHTHTQIHVRTLNRSKLKNKNVLKNSRGRAPSRARIQHITNKQPSMYIYTHICILIPPRWLLRTHPYPHRYIYVLCAAYRLPYIYFALCLYSLWPPPHLHQFFFVKYTYVCIYICCARI